MNADWSTKLRFRYLTWGVTALLCLPLAVALGADSRTISRQPTEVYGPPNAKVVLRIGNGGAGPTGILRALAEDFLTQGRLQADIAWVQNITPLTLDNLRCHVIDVSLTYEPWLEERALQESWGSHYAMVFYDHFVIVGPHHNPAGLSPQDNPAAAFAKIADYARSQQAPVFLSRDDRSGTNHKEQALWRQSGLEPWAEPTPWYVRDPVFPQDALLHADAWELYTLTDRGTWLSNHEHLANTTLYLQGNSELLNPCHALLGPKPSAIALAFHTYLLSHRAQELIADFGRDKYSGEALFTPAARPSVLLSLN